LETLEWQWPEASETLEEAGKDLLEKAAELPPPTDYSP